MGLFLREDWLPGLRAQVRPGTWAEHKTKVEVHLIRAVGGVQLQRLTPGHLVFTREDGRPLHPREVTRAFTRHVLAAGLPIIRLHDLRHTHATLALAAGVHPKVVQERLGHANIAITLDTYSHAVPALEEQAAHTVAALVFGQ